MSSSGAWSSPLRDQPGPEWRSQFVLFDFESRQRPDVREQGGPSAILQFAIAGRSFVSSPGAPVLAKACRRRALAGCVVAGMLALSPGVALAAGGGTGTGTAGPAGKAKANATAQAKADATAQAKADAA